MKLRYVLLILFFWGFFLTNTPSVFAESITVSAEVGDTSFGLKGYAAPNVVVTFKEKGVVTGTITTDNAGLFSKQFFAQDPGPHAVQIYATDKDNKTTTSSVMSFVLPQFQTILIDDIYLSPTIDLSLSRVGQGENFDVFGYTKPNSVVKIELSGPTGNLITVLSNAKGFYSYTFSRDTTGSYSVFSKVQISTSATSPKSPTLAISVDAKTSTSSNAPTSTPAPTVTPTPASVLETVVGFLNTASDCEYGYEKLCLVDSLQKGYIETSEELSTYIVGFISSFSQDSTEKSAQYDINDDGFVDATDLSIVLFYTKPQSDEVLGLSTHNGEGVVLGTSYETLSFSVHGQSLSLLDNLMPLLLLEIMIGIPFFILFIILIVISKRYAKSTT